MDSYIRNQSSFDVPYESIPKRLKFLASENPDKTAFVFVSATDDSRICVTFSELFRKSESFAKGLKSLGLSRKDVVGICDEKNPETLVAIFGVQMVGAIPLLLNFVRKDGNDVVDVANEANCSILIVDLGHMDENWSILENVIDAKNENGKIVSNCIPSLEKLIFMRAPNSNTGGLTMQKVMEYGISSSESLPDIDPESMAALFLTSGSTSDPKIVPFTHYSILISGYYRFFSYGMSRDDRIVLYNDRPFCWSGGFPSLVFTIGVCMVVVRNTSAVKSIPGMNKLTSHIIRSEKCTAAIMMAPFLHEMLADETSELFVDTIVTSGQPVYSSLAKCVGKFCNNLVVIYALTEIGPVSYKRVNNTNPVLESFAIGLPLPGIEMKIQNNNGKTVAIGDSGNIYVRSPIRFTEYLYRDSETKRSLSKSGWFKTDDLGYISKTGDIVFKGRASEGIEIFGELILPSDLEADIKMHHGVHDVVVTSVPDAVSFQHACASIILKSGFSVSGEEINSFMNDLWGKKQQHSFGIMLKPVPKYYVFCDQFQLTHSGKTDRKSVAKHAIETLTKMKAI